MKTTITLSNGETTLVSPEDYTRFCRFRWHKHSKGYAVRYMRFSNGTRLLYMHRLVAGVSGSWGKYYVADHANGDRLDNRRENVRVATVAQNSRNRRPKEDCTSAYKGVWHEPQSSRSKPWRASITFEGVKYNLGNHASEKEAARAYDRAALELFAQYARLNLYAYPAIQGSGIDTSTIAIRGRRQQDETKFDLVAEECTQTGTEGGATGTTASHSDACRMVT